MEHAIHVRQIRDVDGKYSRIYLGDEFCERLLPTLGQVKAAVRLTGENLTLATAPLTDNGLVQAKKLLAVLPRETEVVVNDWGLFEDVKKHKLTPVLGRLMLKYHRDPRITAIEDKIPKGCRKVLHSSALTQKRFVKFLKKNNIRRIELDATPFTVDHGDLSGFKVSLHVPYVYVTTTRQCLTAYYLTGKFGITDCTKPCLKHTFTWKNKGLPQNLNQKGNSLFYKNPVIQPPPQCDRIVHHLQI